MNLDSINKRIELHLASEKHWPIVVDFPCKADLISFIDHFSVGENKILSAERFCGKDGVFKLDELVNTIENNVGNTFIVGLSAFLKISGETYVRDTMKSLLSKNVNGHIVFVTYQCSDYLTFTDVRFMERNQIFRLEGECDPEPSICLIDRTLSDVFPEAYSGFEKIGTAVEKDDKEVIYIATDICKDIFSKSIYNLFQMNSGYDILCGRDPRTKMLPESFGTAEQWNYALKLIGSLNWETASVSKFGSVDALPDELTHYSKFDDNDKWFYFATLSIFGVKKDSYLQHAINHATNYKELEKSLFRAILTMDHKDMKFRSFYNERKEILGSLQDCLSGAVDYCKVVSVKEAELIYYLTDLTQPEREKIIDWLDVYGINYEVSELSKLLRVVYPDLADYLLKHRFKNELLDNYFDKYKYQKIINKILPSFEVVVDEQAHELGFVHLPARSTIVDKLDLSHSRVYFFDALGVEFLGYIQAKCDQYGLSANVVCGRCELPSLTCFNKEFVKACQDKGCIVSDIKELDEIKHHGQDNFSYEKEKRPIYLIKELEIVDNLLKKVRADILNDVYEKAVVISDHGASRLAVIHQTESVWKMETEGVHSGRCCPKNEINEKPNFAIEAEGYWVLANYDRFKGGRKANVEVHGGATLEEVVVPVIEITKKRQNIEAFICDESKVVTLSAKEIPAIKIYAGIKNGNISIRINENYYDAQQTPESYLYEIQLPDCVRKGVYTFDILNGTDLLASNLKFEVKKKGFSEMSLFD